MSVEKPKPATTLPEALTHGHTLEKARIRTAENFCPKCGGFYIRASKKDREVPKTWHDNYYEN